MDERVACHEDGVLTVTGSGSRRRPLIAAVAALALATAILPASAQRARAAATQPAAPTAPAAQPAVKVRPVPAYKVRTVPAERTVSAAQLHAREQGSRVLITSDQTATSQTFANPNGSLTYVASALPRWVARGRSWVKASASLVRTASGSWSPAAAEAGLRLSGGGNGPLATVSDGRYWLSLSWPSRLPAPAVSGATATYASVFPGVDLVVTAMVTGGFSETLVIENAAAARDPGLQDLRLGVALSSGLSERVQPSGGLLVQNQHGTTVFSSPAAVAWDSARAASTRPFRPGSAAQGTTGPPPGAHLATVTERYASGSVGIVMPAGLLASPSTRYPVDIDPSFNVSLTLQAYGEIQNNYPTTNEYNDTYDSLVFVGYDGANIDRGEYLFDLPSDADGPSVNVLSATLTGEVVGDYDGTTSTSHTVNAYYTSPYSTSTTWDNPPTEIDGPSGATFTTTSGTPDQDVSWSLASWVQSDLQGNGSQFSVQLINSQEGTDGSAFVEFSNDPTMTISYVPSVPAGTGPVPNGTFIHFPISDRVSLAVNVGSGNALLTTSDITLPEIAGPLTLGAAYNSLDAGWGPLSMGANGWSQRQGVDVMLDQESNGNLLFLGPDGLSGIFTAVSGKTTYTSPGNFHVTLEQSPSGTCGSTGWTMYWHDTGTKMCFNSSGYLTSQSDRDGNTTAFSYNSSNNHETQITYTPNGLSSPTETVTVTYSGCGCTLTTLSESGGSAGTKTVTYTWNPSGNISSIQQPDGTTINFGYDGSHDLTSITNGASNETQLNYNSAHQVTSVTQPTTSGNTATTRFDYVSSTETLVADPNTDQSDPVTSVPNVTYTVDPSTSLVTKTVDQAGDTVSTSYTPFDDIATYTNGVGGETKNTYGANSGESLTSFEAPMGATSAIAYGNANSGSNPTAAFQPSSSTDPQGNKTAYLYDGAGDLDQSASALPATAKVTYNSDGTAATSTDPTGGVTNYGYNSLDQLKTITPPTGTSLEPITITYDGFGRVATVTDGDGHTVTYTYDLEDRVLKAAYTGGSAAVTVTYAYDGAGNLKTQTDPSGTTSYTYDGLNLVLTKAATSGGGTLSYGYDADGNLTSATDAGGTTTYVYNSRNLLASMTDPTGELWEFAYNDDDQRTTTWFNTNSTESTWEGKIVTSYDLSGRISRIQAYNAETPSDVVSDVSYCYSKYVSGTACPTTQDASTDTSLLQYSTNNQTSTVSQYTYDTGDRLKSVTNDGGKTYSYGYDSDGNLTSGAAYGSLGYNLANQITSTGFSYDGAGNMSVSNINGSQTYNDAGQMTSVSDADGNGTENFTYAGATQDQVLSDGSATGITYGLAGQDGQPWVQSYTPAASSSPVYVIHDQQGTPLGYVQGGHSYMYVTDNLGSVTAIVEYCGCTEATYAYDPYGNITAKSGAAADDNLLLYTGALTDTSAANTTGYVHDGNRWYEAATGNFTTQDLNSYLASPADGNRYAYAADDPANYIDPTGQDIFGAILGAVITEVLVSVTCSAFVVGVTGGLGAAGTVGCFYLGSLAGAAIGYEAGQ
jgi:RHS repeat-associated protein